jgi:FSR family fosmidomycin resistance protein-like MFS transporter
VLLAVPGIVATVVEPGLALLGDTGRRRRVVLGGGIAFVLSLLLFAAAPDLTILLAASCILYPASGAFVSLAQATWMDLEPAATERNMARWVVAGSVGGVVGPLLLGAAVAAGSGWRLATVAAAALVIPVLIASIRLPFPAPHPDTTDLRAAFRGALAAIRRRRVMRWLTLLQLADLLEDVFLGFVALYLVDVGGASPALAAVGVGVLLAAGLVGDALVVRVLRRVDGVRYLRWSAAFAVVAYASFLLVGSPVAKVALLVPLGLLRAGWYAVLQGRLYAEFPARGGTAIAIGAPADLVGSLLPLAIGVAAQRAGLDSAMWILLAAPISLLMFLPTAGPGGDRVRRPASPPPPGDPRPAARLARPLRASRARSSRTTPR